MKRQLPTRRRHAQASSTQPSSVDARPRIPRRLHDRTRHARRDDGAARPAGRPARQPVEPRVDGQRLQPRVRLLPADGRRPRRSLRPQAHVHRRPVRIHRRVGGLRAGSERRGAGRGARAAGWTSVEVLAALLSGGALLAVFVGWERRAPAPMLPLSLFRTRAFAGANAVSFFMYAGLFGALFLMAQLLQTALGYSPLAAGVRLLPWTMPPMFIAPVAGALADRYGNRPFMVLGLALQAVGYAWIALIAA